MIGRPEVNTISWGNAMMPTILCKTLCIDYSVWDSISARGFSVRKILLAGYLQYYGVAGGPSLTRT